MNNYHTPWVESTKFRPSEMNAPLSQMDKCVTYSRPPIVSCDGDITYRWDTGLLEWSGNIRIFFVREDGQTTLNIISTGNITVADNQMAYVVLNETNNATIPMQVASIETGAVNTFMNLALVVLAYRNTVSDKLHIVRMGELARPFDITGYYPGVPGVSTILTRVPLARVCKFPANFSNSSGIAVVAATATTTFDIKKGSTIVGAMTFAAGSATATFTTTGGNPISLVSGDIISIVAPPIPDASLSGIGFVLTGTR